MRLYSTEKKLSKLYKIVPIPQMYNYQCNKAANWGIQGYQVPKKYQDPIQMVKQRQYQTQKKGIKSNKYFTKRGNCLDDETKLHKGPAPNQYKIVKPWFDPKNIKKQTPTKKKTFIDQIFHFAKRQKIPGTGTYNLNQTEQQLKNRLQKYKKVIKYPDKNSYISQCQYSSTLSPGPGNYNAHFQIKKYKKQLKDPKFYRERDKNKNKTSKSILPDIGTYHPHPLDYNTFGKSLQYPEKKLSVKVWGNPSKIQTTQKKHSKNIKDLSPSPCAYNLIAEWRGKTNKKGLKNWKDIVSTQSTRSIYYEK